MQRLKVLTAWAVLYTAAAFVLCFVGFLLYMFFMSIPELAGTPEGVFTFQIIGAGVLLYGAWRLILWACNTLSKDVNQ